MSHVQDLYRQEALGIISSREFDRQFDDAAEQDLIDSRAERDIDAEYEEYAQDMLNSMTPHERKHALNPRRIDLKGGTATTTSRTVNGESAEVKEPV